MKNFELDDGTIYPTMKIAQLNVGRLEISAMAFTVEYPEGHVRFAHDIKIQDASQGSVGWGKTIFEGSLAELITLIRKANLVKEKV